MRTTHIHYWRSPTLDWGLAVRSERTTLPLASFVLRCVANSTVSVNVSGLDTLYSRAVGFRRPLQGGTPVFHRDAVMRRRGEGKWTLQFIPTITLSQRYGSTQQSPSPPVAVLLCPPNNKLILNPSDHPLTLPPAWRITYAHRPSQALWPSAKTGQSSLVFNIYDPH